MIATIRDEMGRWVGPYTFAAAAIRLVLADLLDLAAD
ncbi:hypothetical protein GGD56_007037 [Rhizobium mongolense]|uniref:Transposase n=1 Tax=Rhizobium mongolense TaxID=57676 RepID=A0ABR6J0D8_9HYPH|nr:hypothetical protein [Rhizobium mongolense]